MNVIDGIVFPMVFVNHSYFELIVFKLIGCMGMVNRNRGRGIPQINRFGITIDNNLNPPYEIGFET